MKIRTRIRMRMSFQLLREVEREREDKLCVVCQDREKCIMILPCR